MKIFLMKTNIRAAVIRVTCIYISVAVRRNRINVDVFIPHAADLCPVSEPEVTFRCSGGCFGNFTCCQKKHVS